MKTSEFYSRINELIEARDAYIVRNKYNDVDVQIKSFIEEFELSINKKRPNYHYKFLPKILEFKEEVITVVASSNRRFVNQAKRAKELGISLNKNEYLGYFTTDHKAIFYTEDNRSLGQFSIPSKGVLIKQNSEILMIEKSAIRQKRSNQKYENLVALREVEIGNFKRFIYSKTV